MGLHHIRILMIMWKKLELAAYRTLVRLKNSFDLIVHPGDWLPFEPPDIFASEKPVFPEADFSVHMVLCHRDVEMALWCLKTFSLFSGVSPTIMIHDDGTLTDEDKDTLQRHLHRCAVIDSADADRRMQEVLKNYPRCQKMRSHPEFHCARKLFDPPIYSPHEVVLLLDSDILFFRHAGELLDCATQGRPCFNSDYQNVYSEPLEDLSRRLNINMLPRVNAGMVVQPRKNFDFTFMEDYFMSFPQPIKFVNIHEQTLNAVLLSRAGARRLGDNYQISGNRIRSETVSHHFVQDGSRTFFYKRGVRNLVRSEAIAELFPGGLDPPAKNSRGQTMTE